MAYRTTISRTTPTELTLTAWDTEYPERRREVWTVTPVADMPAFPWRIEGAGDSTGLRTLADAIERGIESANARIEEWRAESESAAAQELDAWQATPMAALADMLF